MPFRSRGRKDIPLRKNVLNFVLKMEMFLGHAFERTEFLAVCLSRQEDFSESSLTYLLQDLELDGLSSCTT